MKIEKANSGIDFFCRLVGVVPRLAPLIFILIIFTRPLQGQGNSAYKHGLFVHQQDSLPYRILWPENFDTSKKYPVVLFLHGAGERGDDNEKQLVHGGKLFLQKRNTHPAIVVFPQCPKKGYWSNVKIIKDENGKRIFTFAEDGVPSPSLKLAMALTDSIVGLDYTDHNRIYVVGLSMGGMGTFEIVSRKPNIFAAALTICGGDNPKSAEKYAGQVPFWIFHGAKDDIVPPINSKLMAEAITNAGGEAKLTIYPEANHNSWDSAFAEPGLLDWLFGQRKK